MITSIKLASSWEVFLDFNQTAVAKLNEKKILQQALLYQIVAAMVTRSKEGTDPEDSNLTEEEKTEKEQAELALRS
ncbi:hypothetical protein RHMOL_Rhmol13G0054200 [Rhododendron molle]|uniref:Uncharacterized protein n=1 Tax=Rhododendron molle TaxID=49168 RepID=A0ACC0L3I4_RHOML|nr:hypothetical protein RHMOL_Rhmol13G0054200 [Rhododendron molle]